MRKTIKQWKKSRDKMQKLRDQYERAFEILRRAGDMAGARAKLDLYEERGRAVALADKNIARLLGMKV